MRCAYPREGTTGKWFTCGKCMPCRINLQRQKTLRLLLEARCHQRTAFVTLTYSDKTLPEGGQLQPEDATKWLKRLRHHTPPFRYALVGEYGERSKRPHYHALLFGLDSWENQLKINTTWGLGHTMSAPVTDARVQYVAGYTVKKYGKLGRGDGQVPEYMRTSRRKGGMGASYVETLAQAYETGQGAAYLKEHKDVARVVRIGTRHWPLDKYLKHKLRERLNLYPFNNVNMASPDRYDYIPEIPEMEPYNEEEIALNRTADEKLRRRLTRTQQL